MASPMVSPKVEVDISYQSISSSLSEEEAYLHPKVELGDHPQVAQHRRWRVTIFFQVFCLLWLVPILALLYLNLKGHVIGASALCFGGCWVDTFNPVRSVPEENLRRFNKNDHNLLGGLQLVAKALEVWFTIIAVALVYLVTMKLASKEGGLPVGYLTRPTEFAEIVNLFDPLLWTTGPSPFGHKGRENRIGRRVWLLIVFSVVLCILCNLMGPATAVLVIPSLTWIETKNFTFSQFEKSHASEPPGFNESSWFSRVTADQTSLTSPCAYSDLLALNYTCTLDPYGRSMDAWISSYLASDGEVGVASQRNHAWATLTFNVNYTYQSSTNNYMQQMEEAGKAVYTDFTFWVPSRQMLYNLSQDLATVVYISEGQDKSTIKQFEAENQLYYDPIDTYLEYNKSLALQIQRNGPILGFIPHYWTQFNDTANWIIEVDWERWIQCFPGYNLTWAPFAFNTASGNYTKCIRIGSGWSSLNKGMSFSIPGAYDTGATALDSGVIEMAGPAVTVDIWSSDRAVFFANGSMSASEEACLGIDALVNKTDCDWDSLFHTKESSPVFNRTQNITTMEMRIDNGTTSATLMVDFVAFLGFATYSLDSNPLTNPMWLIQTKQLPQRGASIALDPAWMLAAWSVADGGVVSSQRVSGGMLLEVMNDLLQVGYEVWATALGLRDAEDMVLKEDYISFVPIAHALSLVDHSTVRTSDASVSDPDHPMLRRNARMYVWGFFMASRTAILGAVVTTCGCLVVLLQGYLGFKEKRRYRSPTQLLVAALEHTPRGEFEGKLHNERAMARVCFHVQDENQHIVRFSSKQGGSPLI